MKHLLIITAMVISLFSKDLLITINKDYKISTSKLQHNIDGKLIANDYKDIIIRGSTKIKHFPKGKKIVDIYWNSVRYKNKNKIIKKPLTTKLELSKIENIIPKGTTVRGMGKFEALKDALNDITSSKEYQKNHPNSNNGNNNSNSKYNADGTLKSSTNSKNSFSGKNGKNGNDGSSGSGSNGNDGNDGNDGSSGSGSNGNDGTGSNGSNGTSTNGINGSNGTSGNNGNGALACSPKIDIEAKTIQNTKPFNGVCVNDGEPTSFADIKEATTCDNIIDDTTNTVQMRQIVAGRCQNIGEPIILRKTTNGCTQQVDKERNVVYPTTRSMILFNGSDITIKSCKADFSKAINLQTTFEGCSAVFRPKKRGLVQQQRQFYVLDNEQVDVSGCADSDSIIRLDPVREYNKFCKPIINYDDETVRNAYREVMYVGANSAAIEITPCQYEEPVALRKDFAQESSGCDTRVDILQNIAIPQSKYFAVVQGKTQYFGDCQDSNLTYNILSTPEGCNVHVENDKLIYERRLYYNDKNGLEHRVTECTPYRVNNIPVYRKFESYALVSNLGTAYIKYRDFYVDPINKSINYLSDVRKDNNQEFSVHLEYCDGDSAFGDYNDTTKIQFRKVKKFIRDTGYNYTINSIDNILYYGSKRFDQFGTDTKVDRISKVNNPLQIKYFETCDSAVSNQAIPYVSLGRVVTSTTDYNNGNWVKLTKQGDDYYLDSAKTKKLDTSNGLFPSSRFIPLANDNNRGLGEYVEKIQKIVSADKYQRADGSFYYENETTKYQIKRYYPSYTFEATQAGNDVNLGWKRLTKQGDDYFFDGDKKIDKSIELLSRGTYNINSEYEWEDDDTWCSGWSRNIPSGSRWQSIENITGTSSTHRRINDCETRRRTFTYFPYVERIIQHNKNYIYKRYDDTRVTFTSQDVTYSVLP